MQIVIDIEELIKALELGKPAYDGEDTNYDVATIEDAIAIIKKYAEIKKKVEEFYTKTKRDHSINSADELKAYLTEYTSHQLCLANQLLDVMQDEV